jgi:hypothetical protein
MFTRRSLLSLLGLPAFKLSALFPASANAAADSGTITDPVGYLIDEAGRRIEGLPPKRLKLKKQTSQCGQGKIVYHDVVWHGPAVIDRTPAALVIDFGEGFKVTCRARKDYKPMELARWDTFTVEEPTAFIR